MTEEAEVDYHMRYGILLQSYVLMDSHYNLVPEPPKETLPERYAWDQQTLYRPFTKSLHGVFLKMYFPGFIFPYGMERKRCDQIIAFSPVSGPGFVLHPGLQ
jgi:hypothetical protein